MGKWIIIVAFSRKKDSNKRTSHEIHENRFEKVTGITDDKNSTISKNNARNSASTRWDALYQPELFQKILFYNQIVVGLDPWAWQFWNKKTITSTTVVHSFF